MEPRHLASLVKKCRQQNRTAQEEVYRHLYNFAMTICSRYAATTEEAKEILNDGFVKVFTRLDKYDDDLSFHGWVKKIMVNTAIDHYRKNKKQIKTVDLVQAMTANISPDILSALSTQEILKLVQQLTPGYRMVFNLAVVEGYTHAEIAEKLGISVGTSKSNLAKARQKLLLLINANENFNRRYG